MGGLAFGAEPPAIGGMILVSRQPDDPTVLDIKHHAAADAAIGTYAFDTLYAHRSLRPFWWLLTRRKRTWQAELMTRRGGIGFPRCLE
nr:hypothetical protein [Marinicella sp. W31]MDC2880301.1 hypothetical protein [Marinicella sp. W31]